MLNKNAKTMIPLLVLLIVLSATSMAAIAQGPVATINNTADERLSYMQSSGQTYTVTLEKSTPVTFRKEPVLRFTNPVSGVVDGGLFVWQDEDKRPVAIAQFFVAPGTDKLWIHEFQSLADESMKFTFEGRVVWSPNKAGVEFSPIGGVNAPAESREGRLTQMRQIVRRFSVKDNFEGADGDDLRLLTTPLVRYSSESVIDGGLFAFAHGTDPELLVLVEALKQPTDANQATLTTQSDAAWRVALAPMTSYAIAAELDYQDFWSVPWRQAPHPLTATFKNFVFPPE